MSLPVDAPAGEELSVSSRCQGDFYAPTTPGSTAARVTDTKSSSGVRRSAADAGAHNDRITSARPRRT